MRQHVVKVDALFEVIAPPVCNNARVDHVNLAHAPSVKSRFGKKLLEHSLIPDLNIPAANAQSFDLAGRWQRTGVSVVEDPAESGSLAINPVNRQELNFRELIVAARRYLYGPAMRSSERSTPLANKDLEMSHAHMFSDVVKDLLPERKILAERNRRNLGQKAADSQGAEQLVVAMADDAPHLDLEESIRQTAGRDSPHFDNFGYCLPKIRMTVRRAQQALELSAVPADFTDLRFPCRP
jgi:hypothetical protein